MHTTFDKLPIGAPFECTVKVPDPGDRRRRIYVRRAYRKVAQGTIAGWAAEQWRADNHASRRFTNADRVIADSADFRLMIAIAQKVSAQ